MYKYNMLTLTKLKEYVEFDPDTGEWNRIKINGCEPEHERFLGWTKHQNSSNNYRAIRIEDTIYQAHRLAWFYMTGEWPVNDIDHINRKRNDNRWSNLRSVSRQENLTNKSKYKNNTSDIPGVTEIKGKKGIRWRAYIYKDKKQINLGTFLNIEEAKKAREAAEVIYFLPKS